MSRSRLPRFLGGVAISALFLWLTVAGVDLYIRYVVMNGADPTHPELFRTMLFGVNI